MTDFVFRDVVEEKRVRVEDEEPITNRNTPEQQLAHQRGKVRRIIVPFSCEYMLMPLLFSCTSNWDLDFV
jgi:hypothetical protein